MQRFGGWIVVERTQFAKTVGNHPRLGAANSNLQRSIGIATEITKADGTPLIARQAGRTWNIGVHLASHRSCVALSGAIGDAVLVRIAGAWGENRGADAQKPVWRIRASTPNYTGNRKVLGAQWIRVIGILVEFPSHWRKHSI